jgi:hypothetical protein
MLRRVEQARSDPISRTMCPVAGRVRPVITDSSTSGFHPSKLAREVMPK